MMIGFSLIAEGIGFHIPKGYLYAAIGFSILIESFIVTVIGGMGSIGGALVAALLLGVIEAYVSTYVGSSYSLLAIFATLFLVLLVSPRGILQRGL